MVKPLLILAVLVCGITLLWSPAPSAHGQVIFELPIVLIEGVNADCSDLYAALELGGEDVRRLSLLDYYGSNDPTRLSPDLALEFNTIILCAVPAYEMPYLFGDETSWWQRLAAWVGRGGELIVIGGPHSFGMGGYDHPHLAGLLPIASTPDQIQRPAELSALYLLNQSGSMNLTELGNNTDFMAASADAILPYLTDEDDVTVIGFTHEATVAQQGFNEPNEDYLVRLFGAYEIGGGTDIPIALQLVADMLPYAGENTHIVWMTDSILGAATPDDVIQPLLDLEDEYDTSVALVAMENSPLTWERDFASAVNATIYLGRYTSYGGLVFAATAAAQSEAYIRRGEFVPTPARADATVGAMMLDVLPPITAYVATVAQPDAEVILRVGDDGDPLLAAWDVGDGRVVAYASDAGSAWNAAWVGTDAFFVNFAAALVAEARE